MAFLLILLDSSSHYHEHRPYTPALLYISLSFMLHISPLTFQTQITRRPPPHSQILLIYKRQPLPTKTQRHKECNRTMKTRRKNSLQEHQYNRYKKCKFFTIHPPLLVLFCYGIVAKKCTQYMIMRTPSLKQKCRYYLVACMWKLNLWNSGDLNKRRAEVMLHSPFKYSPLLTII